MAYLAPHFDPDVFVSYSHGDPEGAGDTPLKNWTQVLVGKLKSWIRTKTEFDNLHVWIDEDVDRADYLTDQLQRLVAKSGVLVIVMSDRYLKSSWCDKELDWFRTQIQNRTGGQGRLLVIRALPTEEAQWPDILRDSKGHGLPGRYFYDQKRGADAFPFSWPHPEDTDREFREALMGLTTDVIASLRKLRDRAETRLHSGGAVAPGSPLWAGPHQIYLHIPLDAQPTSAEMRRTLFKNRVVAKTAPTGDPAGIPRDIENRRIEMRDCEALAIVRAADENVFMDDVMEIGFQEREFVAKARGAPVPCAVLDGTGADPSFDLSLYGIQRFDIKRENWCSEFLSWLDTERAKNAAIVA